jgi:putative MATE family efflux protein
MDKVAEMGEAPLGRLLLKFSIPSIAIMLVNGLYNFIDRIFIGQGMGTDALAAVTAGFPMMILAQGIGALLSAGAGTLISIAVGRGRRDEAASVLGQGFAAALAASVPVMAVSWIFMDPILRAFGTTEEIMPLARTYIGIVTIGFVFQIVSMAVANSLRSQNKPRSAMVATVSGTVLNAILAPIFIFAFDWGIAGAAWATVAAQALSCALTLAFIQGKDSAIRIEARNLAPKAATLASMVKLGSSLFIVNALGLAMLLVANNAMSRFGGATALAAIGIIMTLSNLLAFPVMGVTQGAGALWGYNYGAGKIDRVRALTSIVIASTTVLGLAATAAIELFPHAFIAVFNASDPALVEIGSRGASVFMLSFFTFGLQAATASLFISIGKAAVGGALYILRQGLSIAAMAILPAFMGIEGIYWSGPITDSICTAIAAVVLVTGLRKMAKPSSATAAEDSPRPGTGLGDDGDAARGGLLQRDGEILVLGRLG